MLSLQMSLTWRKLCCCRTPAGRGKGAVQKAGQARQSEAHAPTGRGAAAPAAAGLVRARAALRAGGGPGDGRQQGRPSQLDGVCAGHAGRAGAPGEAHGKARHFARDTLIKPTMTGRDTLIDMSPWRRRKRYLPIIHPRQLEHLRAPAARHRQQTVQHSMASAAIGLLGGAEHLMHELWEPGGRRTGVRMTGSLSASGCWRPSPTRAVPSC